LDDLDVGLRGLPHDAHGTFQYHADHGIYAARPSTDCFDHCQKTVAAQSGLSTQTPITLLARLRLLRQFNRQSHGRDLNWPHDAKTAARTHPPDIGRESGHG
jgi:hypothetical protein